jgi:hypothetical protein
VTAGVKGRHVVESGGGGSSESVIEGVSCSGDRSRVCGEGVNAGLSGRAGSQGPRIGGSAADVEFGAGAGTLRQLTGSGRGDGGHRRSEGGMIGARGIVKADISGGGSTGLRVGGEGMDRASEGSGEDES